MKPNCDWRDPGSTRGSLRPSSPLPNWSKPIARSRSSSPATPNGGAPSPGAPVDEVASLRLVLTNPGFRSVWLTGALASAMRWPDLLVLGVFVFDLTDSPLQVAILFFFRMIPRVLFGIAIGTIADRVSRQTLLVAGFLAEHVTALRTLVVAHAACPYFCRIRSRLCGSMLTLLTLYPVS